MANIAAKYPCSSKSCRKKKPSVKSGSSAVRFKRSTQEKNKGSLAAADRVGAASAVYYFEKLIKGLSSKGFESSFPLKQAASGAVLGRASNSGENILNLLTVDPHFVFTYWEISPDFFRELANETKDEKVVLRYYDITNSWNLAECLYWDIEVFDHVGNWYLKLENPNQRLHLDIGVISSARDFKKIVGADVIHMPKEVISRTGPIKWLISKKGEEQYEDADHGKLKKILGPYFYDLLMHGRFRSLGKSSTDAIFQSVHSLRPDK